MLHRGRLCPHVILDVLARRLLSEKLPTGAGLQLLNCHLLGSLDAAHLGHNLLDDEQVQAVLRLQLVSNILQQPSQLDGVLLEHGAAEAGLGANTSSGETARLQVTMDSSNGELKPSSC